MPTFDNKLAAMLVASKEAWTYSPLTGLLMNDFTWDAARATLGGFGSDERANSLLCFFDIYENDDENRALKHQAFQGEFDSIKHGLVEYTGQSVYHPR